MYKIQKIGMLGGMSFESTTHYYQAINEKVNQALGENNTANLLVSSTNFQEKVELMNKDDWKSVREILLSEANDLSKSGCEKLVIATNTMHMFAEDIEKETGTPVLHIANAIIKSISDRELDYRQYQNNDILLLGTEFTMLRPIVLQNRLAQSGSQVIVPHIDDIEKINTIIFKELCRGISTEESREYLYSLIHELVERNELGNVVLGCTELNMLVDKEKIGIWDVLGGDIALVHDSAEAHISYIADDIVGNAKKLIR